MSMGKPEWPEVGDIVVVTVTRIVGHGAYVSLDEHRGKEGLLHISEISSRWVRNIRSHVRERQKAVLQVQRVDPSKGQIDLSLRRVSQDDKRRKLEEWKKHRKAETLITAAAAKLKVDVNDFYIKRGTKIVEYYGSLYDGLEAAAKRGAEALHEAGVTKKASKILAAIALDKIVIKGVTIQGELEITSLAPRGINEIKETLNEAQNVAIDLNAKASIYSLASPKYRIEVTAEDYRKAEIALGEVIQFATEAWEGQEGNISFSRS
ncbi:translation initiation factor IF-2 subunit alpha [Candidatus Bathyarchaeota archaeon]|nr:translation initiation factor IF-2 subunit alpha [Candidatus Bathyarchaeota archaeon]